MRSLLSIFLLLGIGGAPAVAGPLAPCPTLEMRYTCDGGIPALSVARNARGDTLDFRLGATQSGGALGDALMSLPSGTDRLEISLTSLPQTPQDIAIVGSDKDGACCLATTSLAPPSADLCATQDEPEKSEDKAEETQDQPDESDPFDIALTLDLDPLCSEGAAQHACSGTLGISVTGIPSGLLPLTLEIEPKQGIDTALSGPLTCYDTGSGSQFCRAPAETLGEGLTLPIQISAAPSYEKRTARLCAALSLSRDPVAQIRLVQTALKALEFDPGSLDGQSGPSTRAAVKALSARFNLDIENPLDPAFLLLLGLGPFEDADASNNQACAETILPPRPRPKPVKKPRKKTVSNQKEPDIIYDPPPQICDPSSTVARGDKCACKYEGMIRFNATTCVCQNGLPPRAGAQCY